jgi:quercetin dioxygenase-like cupin family protein
MAMIDLNATARPKRTALRGVLVGALMVASLMVTGCSAGVTTGANASVAGVGAASAAPGSAAPVPTPISTAPVSVAELGAGSQDAGVDVEVPGPVTVTFRTITLAPGSGTGKHCHYGELIAVVVSGTFTHYAPMYPGGVHVYEAGSSLIEGPGYVHEGKNEGTVPVVLDVTYIIPEGDVLAETDLSHCDPQG